MLADWQKKFPKSFSEFPHLMSMLSLTEQNKLSSTLDEIEKTGLDCLNESNVTKILAQAHHLESLNHVSALLASGKLLNKERFELLLSHAHFESLAQSILALARLTPLTDALLDFLFTKKEPDVVVSLLEETHKSGLKLSDAIDFIKQSIQLEGMADALCLFNLSKLEYNTTNLSRLAKLTHLFANPLSRTLFNARLRVFSYYAEFKEPLTKESALDLITRVEAAKPENQLAVFFNAMTFHRPGPLSLRDYVEIDVNSLVEEAMEVYCDTVIAAINTKEEYLAAKALIEQLTTVGGNDSHFEEIKYSVANTIESTDVYSTRDFDFLMNEIKTALKRPLILKDFSTALEQSKGFKEYQASLSAASDAGAVGATPMRRALSLAGLIVSSERSLLGKRAGEELDRSNIKRGRLDFDKVAEAEDEAEDDEAYEGAGLRLG